MDIAVIGINHNLSPIGIREKVSFTDTKKIEATNILLDKDLMEVVILSTCNRSEIYISCEEIEVGIDIVKNFYEEFFQLNEVSLYLFSKKDNEAIEHLFNVTSGLDPLSTRAIVKIIKNMHEEGKKIVITSHDMNLIYDICDYVYVLNKGRLINEGNVEEVFISEEIIDKAGLELPWLVKIKKNMNLPLFRKEEDLYDYWNKNFGDNLKSLVK